MAETRVSLRASRQLRIAVAVLVAVVAFARASAVAGAEPQLGPEVKLVGPTGGSPAAIDAASANGFEAFTWTMSGQAGGGYVRARLRFPGGKLTPIESISPNGARAYLPVIAVDRAGDATVAWLQHRRGVNYAVEVSVRPAGHQFTTPVVLGHARASTCCGRSAGVPGVLVSGDDPYGVGPALVAAPDGTVVIVWDG
jgi:hypothetical protein